MKIIIGGYYGAGNLGDELLLGLLIGWLRAAQHDVAVLTLDACHTREQHGCIAIDRNDFPAVLQQFSEADACILGGGGLFQDHDRFTIADLNAYPAPGISYYAQLCLLARQFEIPYLLFAMGVGPLRTDDARTITREIFQHATFISVRDQASATLLEHIGVTAPVALCADPGWLMPPPKRINLWQRFPQLAGRRIVVVVPREWPFADGWQVPLVQGLTQLVEKGWAILWLPFQKSQDDEVVERLSTRLDQRALQLITQCDSPEEAGQIIAAADALIAMRLHALVMGVNNKTPTAVIEYDAKMAAISKAIRLDNRLRLRLTDDAQRYCSSMDTLISISTQSKLEPCPHREVMEMNACAGRDALLAAMAPLHLRNKNLNWRDPQYNWVVQWAARQMKQDTKRIQELSDVNLRLTSQLDNADAATTVWRKFAPFRAAMTRALEIRRTQGWSVLMRKIGLASYFLLAKPLLKHLAQRHLLHILRTYPGRTPVLFPPIVAWNLPLFQRPHHLAKELASHGYLYFFCIPASIRDHVLTFEEVAPGCFITPYQELIDALPGKVVHLYSTDNIHPLAWIRERLGCGDRVLYEYVDEIHEDISQRHIPQEVRTRHQYLLNNEEVVCVATADKLMQEILLARDQNCALITNGVDLIHFSARRNARRPPAELAAIVSKEKPVIGYFGALAKWFDYALVTALAKQRPNYEIVLIGPDYDGSLRAFEPAKPTNVTLLGTVDYKLLPSYACWFDVAMIPFCINEITESTSPIKLFEYMALGLPIVTTDMPECRKYASVLIGKNNENFIAQIDRAITLRSDKKYLEILELEAKQNSWASKSDALASLLSKSITSQ